MGFVTRRVIVACFVVACFASALDSAAAQRRRRKVRVPVRPVPPSVEKAEEARKAELKQWNRDLAHWRRVLGREAEGEERQRALFHLAVGYEQTGKFAPAVEALQTLREEFPDGAWAVPAALRLFDLKLLREADLGEARELAEELKRWAAQRQQTLAQKTAEAREDDGSNRGPKPPARQEGEEKTDVAATTGKAKSRTAAPATVLEPPAEGVLIRQAYWPALLLCYLESRNGAARMLLRQTGPAPLPRDAKHDHLLARVAFLARSGVPASTLEQRKGDANADAAALLALAELLRFVGDVERPPAICAQVIGRDSPANDAQKGYARFLRGRCYGSPQ